MSSRSPRKHRLVDGPALFERVEVTHFHHRARFGDVVVGRMVTLPASRISLPAYRPNETLRLVGWTSVTTKLALSTNLYLSWSMILTFLPGEYAGRQHS